MSDRAIAITLFATAGGVAGGMIGMLVASAFAEKQTAPTPHGSTLDVVLTIAGSLLGTYAGIRLAM